ncbi:inner centromere protein isoform X2 [Melanotaenia boesemani]|uniref:inner centromere protein isoform X2 n=1 Tax=Melanotaenia boesemani TaxID=1250792 RepID=UPI001C05C455|nr:inner centromere protein isoform X2 [Melanotaenia boesemani]
MSSVLVSVRSLMQMFDRKAKEFISEIDEVHMVWLEEIQQEANRMFSREFNAEPELMPKTPSQKKNSRRKRVSLGRQEENQARRRFSKGKRSNLRGSSVKSLNLIAEEEPVPKASSSEASNTTQQKRTTRKNKQTKPEVADVESQSPPRRCDRTEEVENKKPELVEDGEVGENNKEKSAENKADDAHSAAQCTPKIPAPEVVVSISPEERRSAEFAKNADASLGRTATKITIAETTESSRQSSVRYSLKLRRSLAGLRHSMTQESVRRASRRSMLKRKANCMGNSTSSSNCDAGDTAFEEDGKVIIEDEPEDDVAQKSSENQKNQQVCASVERVTRSVAANAPKLVTPTLFYNQPKVSTPVKKSAAFEKQTSQAVRRSSRSTKRKSPDTVEYSPTKRFSPPKKSQSVMKPSMKSFLHTVQKNQMLMMTPNSLGRTAVIKSFIKHTTPIKVDSKTKELFKLEALKKKQEQEEERMKKMEEEKKKKHEELKRRRDERIKRVLEARVKEEQREEEKKKKIEQKMAQIDGKNDKRLAEEKVKKKVAMKRQEELELKKKLEEEAKKKKLQQEEEKRQQELLAKKKAEEEEQQARKALELKMKQEQREREMALQRERQAAAERERMEKEKALALQRELERAAREKEMQELEEKRKALEEKRKLEEQQRLAAKERALKEKEEAKQREAAAKERALKEKEEAKQREAAAKERALKEKEEAKQREAAAKQAANAQTSAALNVTVDIERSVLSTPVRNGGGLNVTVDLTQSSPQSYIITPKGASKPPAVLKSKDDYGMDQNSDDSTDDESAPRKPIPSWAEGPNLKQLIMKQYFVPPDLDSFFGIIEPPKLENIFYKSKPRYFKRTSSAVWHSPPAGAK